MGRHKTIDDDAVLEAARAVFTRLGHEASTRDIADAAGVSQAVLFQRFGSKDELFFRAMVPEAPDLAELLGEDAGSDPFEMTVAIAGRLRGYLDGFMPTLLKVLAYPGLSPKQLKAWHARLPFGPLFQGLRDRFAAMRERGEIDADPEASALAVISLAHSLVFFQTLSRSGEGEVLERKYAEGLRILWRGMRGEGETKVARRSDRAATPRKEMKR